LNQDWIKGLLVDNMKYGRPTEISSSLEIPQMGESPPSGFQLAFGVIGDFQITPRASIAARDIPSRTR
jgi:hypothetical protein